MQNHRRTRFVQPNPGKDFFIEKAIKKAAAILEKIDDGRPEKDTEEKRGEVDGPRQPSFSAVVPYLIRRMAVLRQ